MDGIVGEIARIVRMHPQRPGEGRICRAGRQLVIGPSECGQPYHVIPNAKVFMFVYYSGSYGA